MSVRNRLALVLAAVLLPLLVGAGLVVAVFVPAQLRTEAARAAGGRRLVRRRDAGAVVSRCR